METFGDIGTLKNQDLASYRWGRYHISLSRSSVSERTYLIEAIAALLHGIGRWETAAEFRSFVSLFHETVHYEQDITTGVGHWDYVVRDRFKKDILSDFRFQTYVESTAESKLKKRTKLNQFADSSIFNAYGFREENAIRMLSAELRKYPSYQNGCEKKFTMNSLLEFDAAFSVYSCISNLHVTEAGAEISE